MPAPVRPGGRCGDEVALCRLDVRHRRLKTVVDLVCPTCRRLVCPTCRRDGTDVRSPRHLTALTHDGDCGVLPALAKVDLKRRLNLRGKHRSTSDVALCSGLAPLINNHFGRRALLRGRLRLRAINATALIEATVRRPALSNRGRGRFSWSFAGRLNTPARTNSLQPRSMNFAREGTRQSMFAVAAISLPKARET